MAKGKGTCEIQVRRSEETEMLREEGGADPGPGVLGVGSFYGVGRGCCRPPGPGGERLRLLPAAAGAGARVPVWRLRGPDLGCEAHSNGALRRLHCSSQLGRGAERGPRGSPEAPFPLPLSSWALPRDFPTLRKSLWKSRA